MHIPPFNTREGWSRRAPPIHDEPHCVLDIYCGQSCRKGAFLHERLPTPRRSATRREEWVKVVHKIIQDSHRPPDHTALLDLLDDPGRQGRHRHDLGLARKSRYLVVYGPQLETMRVTAPMQAGGLA